MPMKPLRPCLHHGCSQLTRETRCPEHQAQRQQDIDKRVADNRPDYHSWYSSKRWRVVRSLWLRQHPLCVECSKQGQHKPATVVDHIKPHKGDIIMFYNVHNYQSLCKPCHGSKTARQDGGFSNNNS